MHLEQIRRAAEQFGRVAADFCNVVEASSSLNRADFLTRIYQLLPKLIDQAISLPNVELSNGEVDATEREGDPTPRAARIAKSHAEWSQRHSSLLKVLEDWDLYWEIFDPSHDAEAVCGSLADDLADIYRDLSEPLIDTSMPPQDRIWHWLFSFQTHWGHHAVAALRTIHIKLQA